MKNDWERIECNVTTSPQSNNTENLTNWAADGLELEFGGSLLISGSFNVSGIVIT